MPFFLPALAAMFAGGAGAAGAAGAGAAAAGSGALGAAGAAGAGAGAAGAGGALGSLGSALPAAAGSAIQIPYQAGMQPGAAAAGDGFSWSKFGDWMGGDKETGESPLSGLSDFGDAMSQRNMQQLQQIPHPVPGGAPNTNPGLFGLQDLIANMNRGGWGR